MTQMDHLVEKHPSYANYLFGISILTIVVFVALAGWYLYQGRKKRRQRREERREDRRQKRSRGGRAKR